MRVGKVSWALAAAAVLGGTVLWLRAQAGAVGGPAAQPAAEANAGPRFALVGTASCSARGCHGAVEGATGVPENHPVLRDEYTRWLGADVHANASAVLLEKRSQDIARHLGIARPEEEPRCLACHTNPLAAGPATTRLPKPAPAGGVTPLLREERLFGVGCESCHGAAGKWLGPHTEKTWEGLSAEKKWADYGMVPVHEPLALARTCAGCHVGAAPDGTGVLRDVNHDLIGAGHPRLHFEFSTFLANVPPHWNPKATKPASEALKWEAGQAACAEAALKLLENRATDETAPWPEFAEYDCFACHHDLKGKSWRQAKGHYGKRMPGAFPWGTWYFAMPRHLLPAADGAPLKKLTRLMEIPYPERAKVGAEARTAAALLAGWQKGITATGAEQALRKVLAGAGAAKKSAAGLSWDAAEQFYLAGHALDPAFADDALHKARAFPHGFDSPREFTPEQFVEALRQRLKK